MNKKIKVIELLNKIYENLDVPEKVKYDDKKYEYSIATQDYKSEDRGWLFQRIPTLYGRWIEREVEILEDEEEIDIENIKELEIKSDGLTEYYEYENGGATESGYSRNYNLDDINKRKIINQLIRAVKQLDKKINKED